MKFYLSSYRLGTRAKKAFANLRGPRSVAIVPNALDFADDPERKNQSIQREVEDLQRLGLSSATLDLREWFHRRETLKEELRRYGALWVIGGNTFVLRQAFHQSGLDEMLVDSTLEPLLYAGYSAGACVIAPTLKGIHLADDPEVHPPGYPDEILWEGLNLIPYCIVPHYQSEHPESPTMNSVVRYYLENKIPFVVLRDGEDLMI